MLKYLKCNNDPAIIIGFCLIRYFSTLVHKRDTMNYENTLCWLAERYFTHMTCKMALLIQVNHCGRVTHKCVSKLTIIVLDNGLSPGRRQAIIWTNAGILSIRTLGVNFSAILNESHTYSFKKMNLKVPSAKVAAILSRWRWVNTPRQRYFDVSWCH